MQHLSTFLLCLSAISTSAQVQYAFEHVQHPYTELEDFTYCDFDQNADDLLEELQGQSFPLFGTTYTSTAQFPVAIGGHGFLRFENAQNIVILDGLFTNIVAVDSTSNVSYAIQGDPGAHRIIVQWHNIRFDNGPEDSYLNYQLRYDQGTGVVEVHAGPNSGSAMDYNYMTGPNCGIFHSPQSFSGCYEKLWVEQNALSPTLDSAANYDFDALNNLPAPNSLFRFTPRWNVTAVQSLDQNEPLIKAWYDNASSRLWMDVPVGASETVRLVDASGRTIRQWRAAAGRSSVDVSDLGPGFYCLNVPSSGRSAVCRFVL